MDDFWIDVSMYVWSWYMTWLLIQRADYIVVRLDYIISPARAVVKACLLLEAHSRHKQQGLCSHGAFMVAL